MRDANSCLMRDYAEDLIPAPRNNQSFARTCRIPTVGANHYRLQPNNLRIHSVAQPMQNSLNPEVDRHFARTAPNLVQNLVRPMDSRLGRNPTTLCRVVP
jgi:hypothetical protein